MKSSSFFIRFHQHYNDVIMGAIASLITSLTIVYSTVYSGADQRKYESSASLAFVRGIHRGPVNSPHKWPVTQKRFPFDDVIMTQLTITTPRCPPWVQLAQVPGKSGYEWRMHTIREGNNQPSRRNWEQSPQPIAGKDPQAPWLKRVMDKYIKSTYNSTSRCYM